MSANAQWMIKMSREASFTELPPVLRNKPYNYHGIKHPTQSIYITIDRVQRLCIQYKPYEDALHEHKIPTPLKLFFPP